MKAIVYNGSRDIAVKDVPNAKIEHPNDVLVRITSTNICGSDLHMYEGRTDFQPGSIWVGGTIFALSTGNQTIRING